MRALTVHKFQDYKHHRVEDRSSEPMEAGHIRIDIKAAGVNFPDILLSEGKYQGQPPFPFVPGGEAAGIVSDARLLAVIRGGGLNAPVRELDPTAAGEVNADQVALGDNREVLREDGRRVGG